MLTAILAGTIIYRKQKDAMFNERRFMFKLIKNIKQQNIKH